MATYTNKFQFKLWMNEDKSSSSDPDFKGQMTATSDVEKATKVVDGKKVVDYSAIPSDRKLSVSLWKNQGKDGKTELNGKVAKKEEDLPF